MPVREVATEPGRRARVGDVLAEFWKKMGRARRIGSRRCARAGPHAAELIAEAQGLHNEAGPHFAGTKVKVLVDVTGTMMNTEGVANEGVPPGLGSVSRGLKAVLAAEGRL